LGIQVSVQTLANATVSAICTHKDIAFMERVIRAVNDDFVVLVFNTKNLLAQADLFRRDLLKHQVIKPGSGEQTDLK
jgi:hypothetical protein